MGYEIELKFRVRSLDELNGRLQDLGAEPGEPFEQADVYFSHPARNFRQTDEAFRIRREGSTNRLTYKGPKLGGPTKTREEFEVEVEPGVEAFETFTRIFDRLGFRPVATVRKHRTPFHLQHQGRSVAIHLDQTETLGSFAEVECLASGPDDLPHAQATVLALAEALGFTKEQIERRSYLRMILEQLEGRANPV